MVSLVRALHPGRTLARVACPVLALSGELDLQVPAKQNLPAIVAALAPLLTAHGIALAGLDVIAGRLIEVNVTCPGGMAKTDALLGTDLSGATMRRLLAHTTERVLSWT